MQSHQILAQELATLLENKSAVFLLDVRNLDERDHFHIGGSFIPLSELPARLGELPRDKPIVVYCHSGYRSQVAVEFLQGEGFLHVKNLVGGIIAWQQQVGSSSAT